MTDTIADWDGDPVYRELKRRFDSGELSREAFLYRGYAYMRAEMSLGPIKWRRLVEIMTTSEPDIAAALAILNGEK